jgi:hypothetical protein
MRALAPLRPVLLPLVPLNAAAIKQVIEINALAWRVLSKRS